MAIAGAGSAKAAMGAGVAEGVASTIGAMKIGPAGAGDGSAKAGIGTATIGWGGGKNIAGIGSACAFESPIRKERTSTLAFV